MKRSLLLFLLIVLSYKASGQRVYLLSVGISDYPGQKRDLILPTRDAKDVASLYQLNKSAEVVLLLNEKATREASIKTAISLFSRADKNDIVVFFFSGHGYPGGFAAYDGLIRYDDIKKIFSSCKSDHKMIFADACFSGRIRDKNNNLGSDKPNVDVMLFLSCRHNEVSIESPSMKNGFFTTCLIRCLKGGGDLNRDRVITAKELFDSVSKGVLRLSGGQQHPVMWGSFNNNMIVMSWR